MRDKYDEPRQITSYNQASSLVTHYGQNFDGSFDPDNRRFGKRLRSRVQAWRQIESAHVPDVIRFDSMGDYTTMRLRTEQWLLRGR